MAGVVQVTEIVAGRGKTSRNAKRKVAGSGKNSRPMRAQAGIQCRQNPTEKSSRTQRKVAVVRGGGV